MIALQHNGTVYVARSCCSMRDPAARTAGRPDPENVSMWHPKRDRHRLIASACGGRFADILRYENVFPETLEQRRLFFDSYARMSLLAERFGLRKGDNLPSLVLFAERERAFIVYKDGATVAMEGIFVSTLDDEAVMALYDLKGAPDPYAFFREAFATVEGIHGHVMFPITVMDTATGKTKLILR